MIGKKFGRLTVLEECKERKRTEIVYKCVCDCGNIKFTTGKLLRKGECKSCGCIKSNGNHITHGKTHTRLYSIYRKIKQRCYNTNDKAYTNYGGRGINICNEWCDDFMAFYTWSMSHGYDDKLTIDRIDNNKGYSPNNCRWVDRITQNNNTRRNVHITYNGKTQTISQWSEELNIKYSTIKDRHNKGWSDKECLFGK